MEYKTIKYGFLSFLIFLLLYLLFPNGDYCSGLGEIFMFLLIWIIFIIAFSIFLGIDISNTIKLRIKFDFITLIFLLIFFLSTLLIIIANKEKFWKKKELVGTVETVNHERGQLILYKNGTFDAKTISIEWSCNYSGKYIMENRTLTLLRSDLEQLTYKTFTTVYQLELIDSVLIPQDTTYGEIKIE